jgi:hypothetical protein
MMRVAIRQLMAIIACILLTVTSMAQPTDESAKKLPKPYKILTAGKQVTVKSTRAIKNIMVWTASGHRLVEQRDINVASYSFNVNNTKEKLFFLMVQYEGMKPYTEKIGIH